MCKVDVLHLPAAACVVEDVHAVVAESYYEEASC
jgi:hypothetical protein